MIASLFFNIFFVLLKKCSLLMFEDELILKWANKSRLWNIFIKLYQCVSLLKSAQKFVI